MKKVNSTDVARAAGCSQATVSKVMNQRGCVSAELRERVMQAARRLGYNFNRGNELKQIVIILPSPPRFRLDGYVATLLNNLLYTLFCRKIRMEVIHENDLDILLNNNFDGGISISFEPELTAAWFDRFHLPLVRINTPPVPWLRNDLLGYVNLDVERAMNQLLDRLYALGHRKIFVLAPDSREVESRRLRYQAFCSYLRKHHVTAPEQRYIVNMRGAARQQNLAAVREAAENGATAFILVDEGYVHESYSFIQELNLSVPHRVSVVCWRPKGNDSFSHSALDGMEVDHAALGEQAVELLEELLKKKNGRAVCLPFKLVEKGSMAPVFQRKPRSRLVSTIMEALSKEALNRQELAKVLHMKPYSGHFCRILKYMFDENMLKYHPASSGRKRLIIINRDAK